MKHTIRRYLVICHQYNPETIVLSNEWRALCDCIGSKYKKDISITVVPYLEIIKAGGPSNQECWHYLLNSMLDRFGNLNVDCVILASKLSIENIFSPRQIKYLRNMGLPVVSFVPTSLPVSHIIDDIWYPRQTLVNTTIFSPKPIDLFIEGEDEQQTIKEEIKVGYYHLDPRDDYLPYIVMEIPDMIYVHTLPADMNYMKNFYHSMDIMITTGQNYCDVASCNIPQIVWGEDFDSPDELHSLLSNIPSDDCYINELINDTNILYRKAIENSSDTFLMDLSIQLRNG